MNLATEQTVKKVGIVILNYNGLHFLKKFLPTLLKNIPDYGEVIIADNASTDDSITFLKSFESSVRIIQLTQNLGFTGGYNHVLSHLENEYFVIVNSDIEVTSNWLEPLVNFLDRHEDYAACQPKILSYSNKDQFEYAGACGGFVDQLGYPFCRGRIFDILEMDEGQYDSIIDVFWTSGACMIIRAKDFRNAGEFDNSFFAHMEEIDLCWRLFRLERKLACVPSSKVYHVGGGTLSKQSPFKTYLNFRNGLKLLFKNLPYSHFWKIPLRMTLDYAAGLKMWIDFKRIGHLSAVFRAHFDFTKWIFQKTEVDHRIPKKRIEMAPNVFSILVNYYLKKQSYFSDLPESDGSDI